MTTTVDTTANAASVLVDRHITQSEGDRTALRYGTKRYAYHDLAALMNRAGNMLRGFGVEAGRHVLIAVAPSPAGVASILGAMKIGAIPVLAVGAGAKRLAAAIAELDPPVIIADSGRAAAIRPAAGERPIVVVGGEAHPERSFVDLLRAAPSSLSRTAVEARAWAVAVLDESGLRHAAHADLGEAERGGTVDLPSCDGVDIGEMLATFARGGEVSLAGQ